MKILILGATGATGKHLFEQALAQGHTVTAVVRDPGKLASRPGLTAIKGDVTSTDDLERVLLGQDAVLGVLGPRERADPICANSARALVPAMAKAGVKRVIWVSAGGVGDSAARMIEASFIFGRIIMPFFLRKPYANHLIAEDAVRGSSLDWTVLRPVQLVDKPTGKPALAATPTSGMGTLKVDRRDLAAFILDELKTGAQLHKLPIVYT